MRSSTRRASQPISPAKPRASHSRSLAAWGGGPAGATPARSKPSPSAVARARSASALASGVGGPTRASREHATAARSAPKARRRPRPRYARPRGRCDRGGAERGWRAISRGLPLGRRDGLVPDRGGLERRRQGRIDLGPLRAHQRPHPQRRHRRRRVRFVPPLARGRGAPARDEPAELPLLHLLAADPALGLRHAERARPRLLPPARRRAARRRHPALPHALPLGPAAGARGERWLAGPRHRRALRRLRARGRLRARRPHLRVDDLQRAAHLHDDGLPGRDPRAGAARSRGVAARGPHHEPRAGRGLPRNARRAHGVADRHGVQHVRVRAGRRLASRPGRRRALARAAEPLVPRDRAARPPRGGCPEVVPDGLPRERMGVREGDLERMRAPLDFLGINLYTRTLVAAHPEDPLGIRARAVGPVGGSAGPRTDFGWEVWPRALHDMVARITRDYDRPAIEITENGCSYADGPGSDGAVHDGRRIEFYRGYLEELARAIEEGADVRGYHAWSLLDNFEWGEGYAQRFGLTWVDFATGERRLKDSGRWYAQVAAQNGL